MSKIIEIAKMLNGFNDESIQFDAPVIANLSTGTMYIYAVCRHDQFGIYLLLGNGEWHGPLLASQLNADAIITSLYNRLLLLQEKPVARALH